MRTIEYGSLIRGITSNINQYINQRSMEVGIAYGQFEYFMLIHTHPGIHQLAISRMKLVGKASVTKAVKALEQQGFIQREEDPTDRRNTCCFVTDAGRIIADQLIGLTSTIEQELFAGFQEQDKEQFFFYLDRLYENTKTLLAVHQESEKEVEPWDSH